MPHALLPLTQGCHFTTACHMWGLFGVTVTQCPRHLRIPSVTPDSAPSPKQGVGQATPPFLSGP